MTAVSASSQRGSESTSSPSMSNMTASVRGGDPSESYGSDTEVLRPGVVDDDRVGRLLGVQLHLFGQLDADPGRLEQPDHLDPVGQVRAGRIADRIARAPVADPEEAIQVLGI